MVNESEMTILQNKLAYYRKNKNLTQYELAEMLCTDTERISQKSVSAWERDVRIPRPAMMQRIEDIFKVNKEVIFFGAFSYSK